MTRVGPAGWSYKDWWGIVYPKPKPRGFRELTFLAQYFDCVEINTSFYGPLAAKTAEGWLRLVESNWRFRFTAKLWRGFTHERTAGSTDESLVKDGFSPLLEAGRLGAVLLQFPWSFRNTDENRDYVARLCARFREYPLVLEVRHGTWAEAGVLDFLFGLGTGLCNIDQPQFKRSVAPGALATSPVGYIRLHGRNYASWFTENKYPGERYDYLYSLDELTPWIDRIKAVEEQTADSYVVTNNHYLGKAVVNAFEICSILEKKSPDIPVSLRDRYPELREIAAAGEPGNQLSLDVE